MSKFASDPEVVKGQLGIDTLKNEFDPKSGLSFHAGKVKKPNNGEKLTGLTSDQESYTGPAEGFFAKFGSLKVDK